MLSPLEERFRNRLWVKAWKWTEAKVYESIKVTDHVIKLYD